MKILVAEDDAVSRCVLENLLVGWGYEVEVTDDGEKAWEILSGEDAPRIALLDWIMPGIEGLALCRRVRAMKDRPYIYIVLLTAKRCITDIVSGLDAGADDYMSKPFDASELQARLEVGKRLQRLQAQLIAGREALRIKAVHDALTGLPNRASIIEAIDNAMIRTRQTREPFSVIMADLDHFKSINDFQGHTVGDRVLLEAARRLRSSARKQDVVGRYGGDEFLILLPKTAMKEAEVVAQQMQKSISGSPFVHNDVTMTLSSSFGVAQVDPRIDDRIEILVDRADMAAYMAKSSGRNCVRCSGMGDAGPTLEEAA